MNDIEFIFSSIRLAIQKIDNKKDKMRYLLRESYLNLSGTISCQDKYRIGKFFFEEIKNITKNSLAFVTHPELILCILTNLTYTFLTDQILNAHSIIEYAIDMHYIGQTSKEKLIDDLSVFQHFSNLMEDVRNGQQI